MIRCIDIKFLLQCCLFVSGIIAGSNFFFQRRIFCLRDTPTQCAQWNQTVVLMRSVTYGVQTYYHHTLVHTEENGPTEMRHLRIGDQILAYNQATGQNHYMPLKGWFLRDKEAVVMLSRLRTHQGFSFLMNNHQNIAVQGDQGLDFPMASQLQKGQILHRLGNNTHQEITFSHIQHQQSKNGIYAPYVEGMNFYIYPEQGNAESALKQINSQSHRHNSRSVKSTVPMILSHCLSNMHNPIKYKHQIQAAMKTINYMWGYKHQSTSQYYESPVNYVIQMLAGEGVTKIGHQHSRTSSNKNSQIKSKITLVVELLLMDQAMLITSNE